MILFNSFYNKIIQKPDKLFFNWRIINAALILVVISCITLRYTNLEITFFESTFFKQLVWTSLGLLVLIIIQWFRIQFLHEYAYHFYLILVLTIVSTYFMPIIGGSQRWIIIGSLSFQPSEIGKLLLVFSLARFISDSQGKMDDKVLLLCSLLMALIPSIIIFKQPDFGTAIVYIFLSFPMLYWGGIKPYYLFAIIAPFISIVSAFNLTIFSIFS